MDWEGRGERGKMRDTYCHCLEFMLGDSSLKMSVIQQQKEPE